MTYERKYPDLAVFGGGAVWRTVEPLHMKSLLPLLIDPRRYGYFPQVGDALVERSRGINATFFLRHTKADVHLSLDSDICEFTKDAIDEMVEQAVTHNIVGAAYICKSVSRTFPASTFIDNTSIEFATDSTPVPIQWAATGCLAVHRRVFEALAETMPLLHERDGPRAFYPFYQTMIYDEPEIGKLLLSEDYAFCQRAKELGFTPYINPAVRVCHIGQYAYRLEDMAQDILKPQPVKITRSGPYWRVESQGLRETPESQGRIKPGERQEIEERFQKVSRAERRRTEKLTKKALTTVSP